MIGGQLATKGYEIVNDIYSAKEVDSLLVALNHKGLSGSFGLREFLLTNPAFLELIFTPNFKKAISRLFSGHPQAIKSLYFDKPPSANWLVNWHQDLTVNLENRAEAEGFIHWRTKDGRVTVQPSLDILESILTARIHLDDCDSSNGALRVIEGSHKRGVINLKEWMADKQGIEQICEVKKGGVVFMSPLILHSSKRTENQKHRRVIHIEFSDRKLPNGLEWKEGLNLL